MFGNMKDMMGKLKEAQKQVEETKERLESVYVKESSGGVTITISGNRQIKEIEIDNNLLQDKNELTDHLVIALNKAIEQASAINEREMQQAAQGMMPGTGNLFK